jgi:hypothetical protein
MHRSLRGRLALSISVLSVAVAATAAGANGPALAATGGPETVAAYAGQASGQPRTALRLLGASLSGVAVLSAKNAWAVGGYNNFGLLAHWNGVRWSYTVLKAIGGINAITAISPTDMWAVGDAGILHWNGRAWSLAKYPTSMFGSVSGSSADNVWAVGAYGSVVAPNPQAGEAALLHWTGRKWFVVPIQSPKGTLLQDITSVASTGPRSAWATAYVALSGESILLHWNGAAWRPVTSRAPGGAIGFVLLNSVVAAPRDTAWAFGWGTAAQPNPQIMYWNGRSWRNNSGPLGQQSGYSDACFEGNGTGWVVGSQDVGSTATGISRWTGKTWTASPVRDTGTAGGGTYGLIACAALSNTYAWAVGTVFESGGDFANLIVHWNGRIWS